jgi:protein subunit release factor B
MNLQLPAETAKRIRHLAVEKGVSPSQIVHEWASRAGTYEVLARRVEELKEELKEEQENNQKEADQNLSWWD